MPRLVLGFSALVLIGSMLSSGVGFAASLSVTSKRLTVSEMAVTSTSTCTISAAADGSVRSNQTGTNFGTDATLDVRSGNAARRLFARFDLTSCAIPASATVSIAILRLTLSGVASGTRTLAAHRVTSAWTENALTWANQPSVAASASASTIVPTGAVAGATFIWSVTSDVQSFVASPSGNHGWRVFDNAEGDNGANPRSFNSREAGTGVPQLVITYVS